ncbi:MAG: helix-turn-helix domain-containing protein [Solirubrobacteraceae bacterium]
MRYEGGVHSGRAFVLDEDPQLAEAVPEAQRETARQASLAAVIQVPPGLWDARQDAHRARPGFGLLVLDGLLIRRVGSDGRFGAELLSAGDLLRPWDYDGDDSIGFETHWRVLTETALAVLDPHWAARMARYTLVGPELAGRALSRSRRLVAMMAIAQQPRLDERLWMIFWELADQHGRVCADGVRVELPLTHEVLSHLAAARRPSVSGALTRLAEQGRLRREGRAWVLAGEPPSVASAL